MTLLELWGRITAWSRRDELARELTDELEDHVRLLARDLEHDGMSPADALATARRQVGNVDPAAGRKSRRVGHSGARDA